LSEELGAFKRPGNIVLNEAYMPRALYHDETPGVTRRGKRQNE
jgi:hypothetical protein